MKIKRFFKTCITFLHHPIVSTKLFFAGSRGFYIGPQMTINKTKFLHMKNCVSIGRNSRFLFVEAYHGWEYHPAVIIDESVTIGNRCSLLSAAPIRIRKETLIASDVLISSENHGTDVEGYSSYGQTRLIAKEVDIGEGCWIGEKASILPGVRLGKRCIVAAGAVVTKSFPDYSMVGGVPARLLKSYSFEEHCWIKREN